MIIMLPPLDCWRARERWNIVFSLICSLGLLAVGANIARGASPNLRVVQPSAGRDPIVQVTGDVGQTNVIEASQLVASRLWWPVVSGALTNGALIHVHAGASNLPRLFYRSRVGTPEPPFTITPQLQSNITASALVTPAGGACRFTAPNGTVYTLNVPGNAVAEGVAVRMTLVTNITGWPLTNSAPSAVRLEPEGLRFFNAAQLEIRYPTNLPPALRTSFASDGNGVDAYLTPDLQFSNRVVIPIAHFSVFGNLRVTPQQAAAMTGRSLANAERRLNQEISSRLIAEREAQLSGQPADPTVFSDIHALQEQFFQNEIARYLKQGFSGCDQASAVIRSALGIERQVQLLGGSISHQAEIFTGACQALKLCTDEAMFTCTNGLGGPAIVARLLGLERQRQLLGLGPECGGGFSLDNVKDCMPIWYGTVQYTETLSANYVEGSENVTESLQFRATHVVTNSSSGSGTDFSVNGVMDGSGEYQYNQLRVRPAVGPCPRTSTQREIAEAGSGTFLVVFGFQFSDGQLALMTIQSAAQQPNTVSYTGTTTDSTVVTQCSGQESKSSTITPRSGQKGLGTLVYPFGVTSGSLTATTNRITGSVTIADGPGGTAVFTVDLHRK